jgi:putative transposase
LKRSRFTEEQIVAALKEHAAGTPAGELCRRLGISDQTLYNWKRKYGDLSVSETRRLKALEEENRRLKKLLADQMLDNEALKDVLSKNW